MGFHWARLLSRHGVEVLSLLGGRSETTRRRAEHAGVRGLGSAEELVERADLVVSIVVPSAARRVAREVAAAARRAKRQGLLYLDANATSPMTATAIGSILSRAGCLYVDGCIIGSAARLDSGTVVYLSGPDAEKVTPLSEAGFAVKVLGPGIAQASAFKILYAGLTKGLAALLVELLIGARNFDLLDEIKSRYDESFPGLVDKMASSIASLTIHAGRRAEEMVELAATLRDRGLKPVMAPAARQVLEQIARLRLAEAAPDGRRAVSLQEALELFYQRGLLQRSERPERPPGLEGMQLEKGD